MQPIQIIAIMLVQNEDIYIERVIRNILDFCDKIIITDHQSTDETYNICRQMADSYSKIDLRSIESPRESARAIEPYFGTNTWIFVVDGDEIFDPFSLSKMREYLLNGNFAKDWNIFPNTLNCISLDLDTKKARGYLAPPSRSGARLYNFFMLENWADCSERVHGEKTVFKNNYHAGLRRYLHPELDWDNSYFRYIHTSFLTRSSLDRHHLIKTRLNPDELMRINNEKHPVKRVITTLQVRLSQMLGHDWKNRKYRRGALVEKDVSVFFF